MPTLNIHNLATLKDYFKTIAEEHKEIDGYRWGELKVIQVANRTDIVPSFLWAQPPEGTRYINNDSDNINKAKTVKVAYLKAVISKKFSEVDAHDEATELVIEDIVSRIYKDKQGSLGQDGNWTMIIANMASIRTAPAEHTIGSTQYRGHELVIELMDNTNLSYNVSRWNTGRSFDESFDASLG